MGAATQPTSREHGDEMALKIKLDTMEEEKKKEETQGKAKEAGSSQGAAARGSVRNRTD